MNKLLKVFGFSRSRKKIKIETLREINFMCQTDLDLKSQAPGPARVWREDEVGPTGAEGRLPSWSFPHVCAHYNAFCSISKLTYAQL